MYIALGQGLTTLWGQNFDVNRNILSLQSFVASFKNISLKSDLINFFTLFYMHMYIAPTLFMILYMFIALGQGQTAPRGQSFDVNRNVLSLHSFVVSFEIKALQALHDTLPLCLFLLLRMFWH